MSANNSKSLVYIVDDEFAIRDSLTMLIESTGQPVRSFESAEAFLNEYDPDQPGCLLLDVRMPLMSGHDLQKELSKRGHYYSDYLYQRSRRDSRLGKSIQGRRSRFSGKTV